MWDTVIVGISFSGICPPEREGTTKTWSQLKMGVWCTRFSTPLSAPVYLDVPQQVFVSTWQRVPPGLEPLCGHLGLTMEIQTASSSGGVATPERTHGPQNYDCPVHTRSPGMIQGLPKVRKPLHSRFFSTQWNLDFQGGAEEDDLLLVAFAKQASIWVISGSDSILKERK